MCKLVSTNLNSNWCRNPLLKHEQQMTFKYEHKRFLLSVLCRSVSFSCSVYKRRIRCSTESASPALWQHSELNIQSQVRHMKQQKLDANHNSLDMISSVMLQYSHQQNAGWLLVSVTGLRSHHLTSTLKFSISVTTLFLSPNLYRSPLCCYNIKVCVVIWIRNFKMQEEDKHSLTAL